MKLARFVNFNGRGSGGSTERNSSGRSEGRIKRSDEGISRWISRGSGPKSNSKTFGDSLNAKVISGVAASKNHASEVESITSVHDLRIYVRKILLKSTFWNYYNPYIMFCSILTCLVFIAQTYVDGRDYLYQYNVFYVLERALAIVVGFDWIVNLILSDYVSQYIMSYQSCVDVVIILSTSLTRTRHYHPLYHHSGIHSYVYYCIQFASVSRILRVNKLRDLLYLFNDEVNRTIAKMCIVIGDSILFWSGVMYYLEKDEQDLPYHTWLYFALITIATVGYGDVTPHTVVGRIFCMFMVASTIITIPAMTQELIEKLSLQSVYARAYYEKKTSYSRHVIICGNLSSTFLDEFFAELFHEDHDTSDIDAVILNPNSPDYHIIRLLGNENGHNIYYLQGSALRTYDLSRAQAEIAIGIFILTDKFTAFADEEDSETIMHQFSVKKYIKLNNPYADENPPLFCTQLIRPENERHLFGANDPHRSEYDVVVCLNEIKMGILAKSTLFPGVCTLLMNVVTSIAVDDDLIDDDNIDPEDDLNSGKAQGVDNWLREYLQGCDWEVYTTELSDIFVGAKFVELSYLLYKELGVVLFGLRVKDLRRDIPSKLILNPFNYYIPKKTDYHIEAYLFAKNKAASDLTFTRGKSNSDDDKGFSVAAIQSVATAVQQFPIRTSGYFPTASSRFPVRKSMDNPKTNSNTNSSEQLQAPQHDTSPVTHKSRSSILGFNVFANKRKSNKESFKASQNFVKSGKMKKASLDYTRHQYETEQEHIQRLEDEHFQNNYILRATPLDLQDVLIKTSVIQEIPQINNHIIIMGKGINNIFDLIRPLRARHLGKIKHIVILYPLEIPHHIWRRIAIFDAIVFVRGSHLEENDIRRAGVFRAEQVIVLSDVRGDKNTSSGADKFETDSLADSDAIFCYQCVKRLNCNAHVVIEMVKPSNIGFLDIESNLLSHRKDSFRFSPRFASGSVFTGSLLDTLACQSFHNPSIIDVVRLLVSGVDQVNRTDLRVKAALKAEADKGLEDGSNIPSFDIPEVLKVQGSALYQMVIPDGISKYEDLYRHLASRDQIPLGILRGVFSNILTGPKGNSAPYVFTNPGKDTVLYPCDKVFVLSPRPIQLVKGNIKDMLVDLQVQHKMNHLNANSKDEDELINKVRTSVELKLEKMSDKLVNRIISTIENRLGGKSNENEKDDSMNRELKYAPSQIINLKDDYNDDDDDDDDDDEDGDYADELDDLDFSELNSPKKSVSASARNSKRQSHRKSDTQKRLSNRSSLPLPSPEPLDSVSTVRVPWHSPRSPRGSALPHGQSVRKYDVLPEEDEDEEDSDHTSKGAFNDLTKSIESTLRVKPSTPKQSRISMRVHSEPNMSDDPHNSSFNRTALIESANTNLTQDPGKITNGISAVSLSSIYPENKDDISQYSPISRPESAKINGPPSSSISPAVARRRLISPKTLKSQKHSARDDSDEDIEMSSTQNLLDVPL